MHGQMQTASSWKRRRKPESVVITSTPTSMERRTKKASARYATRKPNTYQDKSEPPSLAERETSNFQMRSVVEEDLRVGMTSVDWSHFLPDTARFHSSPAIRINCTPTEEARAGRS